VICAVQLICLFQKEFEKDQTKLMVEW